MKRQTNDAVVSSSSLPIPNSPLEIDSCRSIIAAYLAETCEILSINELLEKIVADPSKWRRSGCEEISRINLAGSLNQLNQSRLSAVLWQCRQGLIRQMKRDFCGVIKC